MSSKRLLSLLIAVLTLSAVALGGSITSVVVYGDSLSDNGNLYAATGLPGSPYYMGRRSDGPVAVEYLASALGVPLHDFAWIGATTGVGNYADGGTTTSFGGHNLPGMLTVFNNTKGGLGAYTGALFVVWGGPNDLLAPSPLDPTAQAMIARSIGDLLTIVGALQSLGATDILVPGMPDIGLTPFLMSQGATAAAQASAYTDAFNAALAASLPTGVNYFDSASLLRSIVANPSAYGLTNVTSPCFNGITVCSDPNHYLFFDDFHPTTAADAIIAQGFASTVPEPGSLILIAAGLGAIGLWRQVQSRRRI
jgi:cholinesterase